MCMYNTDMDHPCTVDVHRCSPWTPLWTRSMDYPCGSPLILKVSFHQRSERNLETFSG